MKITKRIQVAKDDLAQNRYDRWDTTFKRARLNRLIALRNSKYGK